MESKKRSRTAIPSEENVCRTTIPPPSSGSSKQRQARPERSRKNTSFAALLFTLLLALLSLITLQASFQSVNAFLLPPQAPHSSLWRCSRYASSPPATPRFPVDGSSSSSTRQCRISNSGSQSAVTALSVSETQTEFAVETVPSTLNGDSHGSASLVDATSALEPTTSTTTTNNGFTPPPTAAVASFPFSALEDGLLLEESPVPTENGGYSHTVASKAKISAANKGKTPWNKGKTRSDEVRARIALGVRAKNRERFLIKLADMGMTEDEYDENKKKERREKDAERKSRRTENGGYRPTEETKKKISDILKRKYANGEVKPRAIDPSKVRRGFKHTEETRKKISESLRKRWADDPKYRANMVEKCSTNNNDNVRQKISESLRKKWQDPVFRAEMMEKMSKRKDRSGTAHQASHRQKISEAMRAKWQDEDYRKKALDGIAKRKVSTTTARPRALSPRLSSSTPRKPRAAKKVATTQAAATSLPTTASTTAESPAVSPFVGDGLQLVQPRTIPREPKKRRGRAKGTKNKPKPAVKKVPNAVAVEAKPKKVSAKKAAAKDGDSNNDDDEALTKKKAKKNGSVSRLREERRDLYDLLYGDEDETPVSDTSLMNLPLGDDNLDAFDPYGLDDF